MTHSVIRLTELTVDPDLPNGYAPTLNQLVRNNTQQRLNGHLLTTPIVRYRDEPESSGAPATPEQRDQLRVVGQPGAVDPGLVIERVHGEVTLPADLETLLWLREILDRVEDGGVISVEVWQQLADGSGPPSWNEVGIRLLHLRDLFTTFTGDVLWFETPRQDDGQVGPVVADWGYYQRLTTTVPPGRQAADPV